MRRSWTVIVGLSLMLGGCFVPVGGGGGGGGGGPVVTTSSGDGAVLLGSLAMPGYHLVPGGGASLPGGDFGYLATANGQGGYRVAWSDTNNDSRRFWGAITTDGTFDPAQLAALGSQFSYTLVAPNQITFDSIPGSSIDGIDLVSSTDPIYLEAHVDDDSVTFGIYYDSVYLASQTVSEHDPVAFTSP